MATTEDATETNSSKKRRSGIIWWVIALLVLLGLVGYLLTRSNSDDKTEHARNKSSSSQSSTASSQQSLKSQFETAIPKDQRTILFIADTTNPENPAAADAALTKVADFYKAHDSLQLVVNGSIFNGQPGDRNEQLAQERAQQVKQQLMDKGVNGGHIVVTAKNTYKGNTDAAKAEYARSVTIDAQ